MKIDKCYVNNESVANIWVNGLQIPTNINLGEPLYKVGLLSDIHIRPIESDNGYSQSDFTNALNYFKDNGALMGCASGDLTDDSWRYQYELYTGLRDTSGLPFFECTGNHDAYPVSLSRDFTINLAEEACIAYHIHDLIGKDLLYCVYGNTYEGLQMTYDESGTFTTSTRIKTIDITVPDNDVYIFIGILGEGATFFKAGLTWFRDILERFRNQRCFVFEHCRAERLHKDFYTGVIDSDLFADKVSGNIAGSYLKPMWGTSKEAPDGLVFESLMSHYTNCLWFHGHSHMSAAMADDFGTRNANIDRYFGDAYDSEDLSASRHNSKFSWSIHICSCSEPREVVDGTITTNHNGSQGCFMSVYKNCVEIKYLDFANQTMLKRYVLDTTLNVIEQNTYVDKLNYFD